MSDAAFTRLADLIELGFRVDPERSSDGIVSLEHPGAAPSIRLSRDGTIASHGAALWPSHLPYGFEIPSRDARLFGLWCKKIDQPTRFEDFRFDLTRAVMIFSTCGMAVRFCGTVCWHVSDLRDRLRPQHK